jgi:hypothetical protein
MNIEEKLTETLFMRLNLVYLELQFKKKKKVSITTFFSVK